MRPGENVVRVGLAEAADAPAGGCAARVRAGGRVRVVVRLARERPGPVELEVVTALGVSAWRKRVEAARGNGTLELDLDLPPDWPSGGTRLLARDVRSGEGDSLRLELLGRVPVRPVWRYRQRILVRDAGEASRVDVSALVPRGMPLKLAVGEPVRSAPGLHEESTHDDAFGNRWAHAGFDACALDSLGVRAAHGRTPSGRRRRSRPLLERERHLISFTTAAHLPSLAAALAPSQPHLAPPLGLPAHYRRFVEPEPSIESDAPEVLALAEDVPGLAEAGPLGVCEAAHRVVHRHMRYVIQRGEHGARFAAQRGVGDCTEYAALFVALCRARGVPARVAAGFFPDERNSAHATAEVYLRGVWFGLDPTNQRQFHLGLPASFVPMMRANWMSGDTAYQPFSASLESRGDIPQLSLCEDFQRAEPPETPGEASEVAWLGGEWLTGERTRPSLSATLREPNAADASSGRVTVWLINETKVAWRVQLLAAVEPRTPLVYAVRELRLAAGEGHQVELPHPHQIPGLAGSEGLLLALLSGEKLLAAQAFG